MHYEIDHTKHVRIAICETCGHDDKSYEEMYKHMFNLFDRGWHTLETMRKTADGFRTVLYNPEYKQNKEPST